MLIDKEKHSIKKSILRIGEVSEVRGQSVTVIVDTLKNTPDIFYDGDLLKNVSVGSYIEIRKGFLSLIGKIDGEKIVEKYNSDNQKILQRELLVSLTGAINPLKGNHFEGGLKELPMIGNEAFLVTAPLLSKIHDLNKSSNDFTISIGNTALEGLSVLIDIDKLFSSHIAIFGNTGSGKSNTLAKLYSSLMNNEKIKNNDKFKEKCKFILFDFNGEYSSDTCICTDKKAYILNTRTSSGDKIPLPEDILLDYNFLSIIAEATDKTQRPFIKRTLDFYNNYLDKNDDNHIRNILKNCLSDFFSLSDKDKVDLIRDYLKDILLDNNDFQLDSDLSWNSKLSKYMYTGNEISFQNENERYINDGSSENIKHTICYHKIEEFKFSEDIFTKIIQLLYIRLIMDIISDRAKNDHIAPVIHRIQTSQQDLNKIIQSDNSDDILEGTNFVIIDLKNINLKMKKIIPLILSKYIYDSHKDVENNTYLNIIIDEAHNILSSDSFRESESWKDYRLETFEEIIKEGRKFGAYLTIASQRPSDISPTIISQAHNYFIHRLVNQEDLRAIATSVSYIDKLTLESIPTLPVGSCIFNGISTQMPILISVDKLNSEMSPNSETICISNLLK